ncbi:MAG: tetratricopeptide repeat protein [Chloroflexota bacterium]|nr:tetratricopeptide repeat protein [Chloroflexota bacterium]
MSSNLNNVLSQAYGLIEADQLEEAVALLKPILSEQPNNADAWWLYAHAVTNIDDARASLDTVLSIDPEYPEARKLLEMLDEASRGDFGNPLNDMSLQPIRTIPALPDESPEFASVDEPFSPVEKEFLSAGEVREKPSRGGIPWLRIAALALLFICALVAAFLLSQNLFAPGPGTLTTEVGSDRTATAVVLDATDSVIETQVADAGLGSDPNALTATAIIAEATAQVGGADADATAAALIETATAEASALEADATASVAALAAGDETEEPVATPVGDAGGGEAQVATEEPAVTDNPTPTREGFGGDADAQAAALEPLQASFVTEFGESAAVEIADTAQGETLLLTICSAFPNVDLRDTLRRAVEILAGQGLILNFDVERLGIRLVSCEDQTVYRTLTADIQDVASFAQGMIDATTFEARLRAE